MLDPLLWLNVKLNYLYLLANAWVITDLFDQAQPVQDNPHAKHNLVLCSWKGNRKINILHNNTLVNSVLKYYLLK